MKRSAKAPRLAETRREAILEALRRDGAVRVSDLAESTGVTPITIRRDIVQLEEEGVVRRVHGGAVLVQERSGAARNDFDGIPTGSRRIGMLVPSFDYYWPGVIEGAQQEAAKHGLTVVLRGSSYEADDTLPHVDYLLNRAHAAGLILAPNMKAAHSAQTLESLATSGVPMVLVERTAVVGPFHRTVESVVSDHSQGAAMAMRHLAELGHRRIGLVISGDSPTAPHLRQGWLTARRELGIDDLEVLDETVASSRESSWGATVDVILDKCLDLGTTALLVHADQAAASITQRCEIRGLSVPGDLSIVAYDDEVAELCTPPLTAVRPPRTSLGRAAVNLVAERIRNPDRPAHSVVITPSLHVRQTTGSPRSVAAP
jgi:DNA-binding LacI/PurR family transcriptional regulator